jgi:CTP:molybdopterin cytidylyltransferase MocA
MILQSFAGLILAGGEGRRWGGPKAWACLPNGQTFLDACCQILLTAGASPVLATLPPDSAATELSSGAELLALPEKGLDMLASARFGLARLLEYESWKAVVLLPVDHPLVSPDTPRALVGAGPPAAIPSLDGRHGHPICLWRQIVTDIVYGNDQIASLRDVLKLAPAQDVAVDDSGVRINCNTPEALHQGIEAQMRDLQARKRAGKIRRK